MTQNDQETVSASLYVALGLCQLNQWAMDFDGNLERIMESTRRVKALGARYRLGPELEVCGYSCDDHFNEAETTGQCWMSLCHMLESDISHNCLVDVGMPVEHKSVRYNCRVFILNSRIILIRPKMFLACDGAYRENRWFGAWSQEAGIEEFDLPKSVQKITNQTTCPFGFAAIQANDCILSSETCEELFVPQSPHLALTLGGVDIFTNGSASYFQVAKLRRRFELIMGPTAKMGGIYMYCNLQGNDSGKLGFDGASFIACNGEIVAMAEPFQLHDITVLVEHINVKRVRSFRACNPSYAYQASGRPVPTVRAPIWLSGVEDSAIRVMKLNQISSNQLVLPEVPEELLAGSACWMWDYLRRSGASGFFLALSGGADSATCACIVRWMCELVWRAINKGDHNVLQDLEAILCMPAKDSRFPKTPRDTCYQLLHTAYLKTKNSSSATEVRAQKVAEAVNSYHVSASMDDICKSMTDTASKVSGLVPRFASMGGSKMEDLALQSVQARSRSVFSYLLASMLPQLRIKDRLAPPPTEGCEEQPSSLTEEQKAQAGFLLAIGTGNLDETLCGYYTKGDNSAGDIGPIGGMSKANIKKMLRWASIELEAPVLEEIVLAAPTAELQPAGGKPQTDEEDIGLTYDELYLFGTLRKSELCGPVEMYERLVQIIRCGGHPNVELIGGAFGKGKMTTADRLEDILTPAFSACIKSWVATPELNVEVIAEKVKRFFTRYATGRHKVGSLPPSYHCEAYDCDASRFDWRPINYPKFERQFKQIDRLVKAAVEGENR